MRRMRSKAVVLLALGTAACGPEERSEERQAEPVISGAAAYWHRMLIQRHGDVPKSVARGGFGGAPRSFSGGG